MKRSLVILGALSLTAISFTKCNEASQSNESEIQSQSSPSSSKETSSVSQPTTGLSAKAASSTVINLTWDSVPNATAYWIYRDGHVAAIVTSSNYTHKAVKPGTTYNYAIAAVVKGILGAKSSSVKVTTPR